MGEIEGRREASAERRGAVFTPRQRQIIALIADGRSNDEIAARLGITSRTVRAHTDALRQKLGVKHRREILAAFRVATGEDPFDVFAS